MITYRRYNLVTFKIFCVIIIISIIVLITDIILSEEYVMKSPSSSSLAFWEDNRTLETGRPLPSPIITIDKVNLTNLTLIIAACCRNVEKHLIGFQKNIYAIGSLFRSYRLYLCESDSKDATLKFIQQWEINDPNHVHVYAAGQQRWRRFFRK
jgi:hypothetical protein